MTSPRPTSAPGFFPRSPPSTARCRLNSPRSNHEDQKHPATKRVIYIEGSSSWKVLAHLGIYASVSRTNPGEISLDFVNYHHDLASDKITPVTADDFAVQVHIPKLAAALRVEVIRYDEAAPHNVAHHPLADEAIRFEDGRLTLQVPPFTHYQLLRIGPR